MSDIDVTVDDDDVVINNDTPDVEVDVDPDMSIAIEVPEQGPSGPQGIQGEHGNMLLWGISSPGPNDGVDGDSWFDSVSRNLYGRKQGGIWPAPVSLIGLQGIQGIQGIQGEQGIQGVTGNTGAYFRNYVPNPGMQVSLQNGNTSGNATTYWPADGFVHQYSHSGQSTIQRVASQTPGGSPYRLRVTVNTSTTPTGSNYDVIQMPLEGSQIAEFRQGMASPKQITIQFNVKAPAGTYYVALQNSAQDRYYLAPYTISAGQANTDVQKSVTVTLDSSGTWLNDEGVVGLRVYWVLMAGTNGTAGSWQTGALFVSSGSFNLLGSTSNVFELADVSVTIGSVAPAFILPAIEDAYRACARYLEIKAFQVQGLSSTQSGRNASWPIPFRSRKAKVPTMSFQSMTYSRAGSIVGTPNIELVVVQVTTANSDGDDYAAAGQFTADARVI